jgi:hypothetical protein
LLYRFIKYKVDINKDNAESLGKALGIYPYAIRNYLKKKSPSLTDGQIIDICNYYGIVIKLEVELKKT